jgi:hypothetical protein
MSQIMGYGIVLVVYVCWLLLGIKYHWNVAWIDWIRPYFHFAQIESTSGFPTPFAVPIILALWMGFAWYKKSMIGEA